METLIKLVMDKTGMDQMKATLAVTTVLSFVKEKLPPQVAGQLDGLLAGGAAPAGGLGALGALASGGADGKLDAGDVMGALGGFLKK